MIKISDFKIGFKGLDAICFDEKTKKVVEIRCSICGKKLHIATLLFSLLDINDDNQKLCSKHREELENIKKEDKSLLDYRGNNIHPEDYMY